MAFGRALRWGLETVDTLSSRNKRMRAAAFDAISRQRRLAITDPTHGEVYVVDTRDRFISRELFISGQFDEQKLVDALYLLWRRNGFTPDVLVDVGANIGPTCIAAVAQDKARRAIAIEPDPMNCRLLRANIALNGLDDRITVLEAAAGPVDGETLELELSAINHGDHRIRVPGSVEEREVVKVQSVTLDAVCGDTEGVMLWLDTQGFEAFVLQGASTLIARQVPVVLEFWPFAMKRTGSFNALVDCLKPYAGFIDLGDTGEAMQPIAALHGLRRRIGDAEVHSTDILMVPHA